MNFLNFRSSVAIDITPLSRGAATSSLQLVQPSSLEVVQQSSSTHERKKSKKKRNFNNPNLLQPSFWLVSARTTTLNHGGRIRTDQRQRSKAILNFEFWIYFPSLLRKYSLTTFSYSPDNFKVSCGCRAVHGGRGEGQRFFAADRGSPAATRLLFATNHERNSERKRGSNKIDKTKQTKQSNKTNRQTFENRWKWINTRELNK